MESNDLLEILSGFFMESRATFCIEIDSEFVIKSVSKGYFKSINDHHHDPLGKNLRDLVAGSPAAIDTISDCVVGNTAAIAFILNPPFPAPRNVRGLAIRTGNSTFTLVLERDIGTIGKTDDVYQPKTTAKNVHRELLDTQAELSKARNELEFVRSAVSSLEVRRSMLELFIPLLHNVAESAKTLASKAVIIATRLDYADSKTCKLLGDLECEGIELHAAANRILRGLK